MTSKDPKINPKTMDIDPRSQRATAAGLRNQLHLHPDGDGYLSVVVAED